MIFGFNAKTSDSEPDKPDLFSRLKTGLAKTRQVFSSDLSGLITRGGDIDLSRIQDLEDQLLMADVGVDATTEIIGALEQRIKANRLKAVDEIKSALHEILLDLLQDAPCPLAVMNQSLTRPQVLLLVGVNGAGKTTTAGKLARQLQSQGKSVLFAAGDTFRAAATEQLQAWGKKINIPVISQAQGADAAAVIFDALQSARARNIDVVIADTAGRLQSQMNLMDELQKITRTIFKFDENLNVERILVVDAGAGQNVLNQVRQFNEAIGINGIILTKLDGTAKGGIIFAVSSAFKIAINYIGVGEQIEDLQLFNPVDFVNALIEPEA